MPHETRHWKLDRIKSVVALDEYFESVVDEVQEQLAGGLSAFASSESKQYEIILSERGNVGRRRTLASAADCYTRR